MAFIDRRRKYWGCPGLLFGSLLLMALVVGLVRACVEGARSAAGGATREPLGLQIGVVAFLALVLGLIVWATWSSFAARRDRDRAAEQAIAYLAEQERQAFARQVELERWQTEQERLRRERRDAEMMTKWGPELGPRILRGDIWQDQTEAQVVDALGWPADIEEQVLKTKVKRVFKYRPLGAGRYGFRVMLDDGIVVGWHRA